MASTSNKGAAVLPRWAVRARGFSLTEVFIAFTVLFVVYAAVMNLMVNASATIATNRDLESAYTLVYNALKELRTAPDPVLIGLPLATVRKVLIGETPMGTAVTAEDPARVLLDGMRMYPIDYAQSVAEVDSYRTSTVTFEREVYKQVLSRSPSLVQVWVKVMWKTPFSKQKKEVEQAALLASVR